MVSKAEARRRADRRNGKLNANNGATSTESEPKAAPSTVKADALIIDQHINKPTQDASTVNTRSQMAAPVALPAGTAVRPPTVNKLSKVDILIERLHTAKDGTVIATTQKITSVPADKLLCASRTFEQYLSTQPPANQRTDYQFLVSGPGIKEGAVFHIMRWLDTVKCPFPSSYHGKKQVAVPRENIVLVVDTLVVALWLQLRAPFDVNTLLNHIWNYFKDSTVPIPPGAVLSLWSAGSTLDPKLQRHALYRAVQWVKELDSFSKDDKEYQSFLVVFEHCPALATAFKASFRHARRVAEGEKRAQKSDGRAKTARAEDRKREQRKNKDVVDDQAVRKVLNQKGVGTISAEDAEKFRRSA